MTVSGIIPARAGFTTRASSSCTQDRDHPRSRGVYAAKSAGTSLVVGSSPLARGLRASGRDTAVHTGIIPARAGFTGVGYDSVLGDADHPRSRGVYS